MNSSMSGEYQVRGEYHKYLDPKWSYYPIYIRKVAFIDNYLQALDRNAKILDAGCGEGVLVEKYLTEGRDISGIDINYSNDFVQKGDILHMPFSDNEFDLVFFLDVIEHLQFLEQGPALLEINRVLKSTGKLLISVPNLAHKASRWNFYKTGMLIRTANIFKHPGDRPIKEFLHLFSETGFSINHRFPIKLTLPPYQEKLMMRLFSQKKFEEFIYSPQRNPDDCFLNIFVLEKKL